MSTTETKVKHKLDCARVFNRYDANCPRCQELMQGATPREGWGDRKRQQEAIQGRAISAHFKSERHLNGECGVICTFGDW